MDQKDQPFDVIVVGAGASGITAAAFLSAAGLDTLVLEAGASIGGRVRHELAPSGLVYDLGAQWLEAPPRRSWDATLRKWAAIKQDDLLSGVEDDAYWSDGNSVPGDDVDREDDRLRKRIARVLKDKGDCSIAEAVKDHPPSVASAFAKAAIGPLTVGLELDAISARDEDSQPESQDRLFKKGFAQKLKEWAGATKVQTAQRVTSIKWTEGGPIVVSTGTARYEARAVVVTVSVGVLQARDKGIQFDPPLSDSHLKAIDSLQMSRFEKLFVSFKEPVLKPLLPGDATLAGYYTLRRGSPMYTVVRAGGRFATFFFGGSHAERVAPMKPDEAVRHALEQLQAVRHAPAPETLMDAVDFSRLTDWWRDPLYCGSYSASRPGLSKLRQKLGEPLGVACRNRLIFAGEATHSEWSARVYGAMDRGLEVAKQLAGEFEDAKPVRRK